MKTLIILFISFLFSFNCIAQPSERRLSREEYIQQFKNEAIKEMILNKIPASITLAQAVLESGDGNSPLAKYANNHFGIKCHSGWKGETFIQDDDTKNECFRKYFSVYDSYKDHSQFLMTRSWYMPLFDLKLTDYKAWAHGLKKSGYATHPRYAEMLIEIIEKYELHQFDKITEMPILATVDPKAIQVKEEEAKSRDIVSDYKHVHTIDFSKNNIKFIVAKQGDTYTSIAEEEMMGLWQIMKYNDFDRFYKLKDGDVVYLQPKRNKTYQEFHTVQEGETMHFISQKFGIKLRKLYKRNNLKQGDKISVGQRISLNKTLPEQ